MLHAQNHSQKSPKPVRSNGSAGSPRSVFKSKPAPSKPNGQAFGGFLGAAP